MKLDFSTLAFGYLINEGGGNPNWATSLGQGKDYKINSDADINEILKGMIHFSVPIEKVSIKKGKGGKMTSGKEIDSPIILAALFPNVYINNTLIINGKFLLVISRDTSESHAGRLLLKYSKSNTYNDNGQIYTNDDFFQKVRKQLGLTDDACWFISDIHVDNQEKLVFKTYIVDPTKTIEYATIKEQHNAWENISPTNIVYDANFTVGENIILYGVPGCGKSYEIQTSYCNNVDEDHIERIVFHPDYSYSDFVGQILPQNINGNISYQFIAGPFTRIMQLAYNDPYNNYYLIIEEINRGNAPAIFGDIFQLLDRENGESIYEISNTDIANIVYDDATHPVRIPPNLILLATMNTADQNVFTLDTAFKRRWRMECVKNNIAGCKNGTYKICDSSITWQDFLYIINPLIIEYNENSVGSEDKRLGAYFVNLSELQSTKYFSEKVLMYLWNDAFKYTHDKIFKPQYKTLEQLIDGFVKYRFEIFQDDLGFINNDVTPQSIEEKK